jgi:hypothetical protein
MSLSTGAMMVFSLTGCLFMQTTWNGPTIMSIMNSQELAHLVNEDAVNLAMTAFGLIVNLEPVAVITRKQILTAIVEVIEYGGLREDNGD